MKKNIKLNHFFILVFILFVIIFSTQDFYRIFSAKKISDKNIKILEQLGKKALDSLDIPVSSILLYKNKIIGKGYNTVLKYDNAGGHAEINAISDALKKVGHEKFSVLNRDSLVLISTYEPCPMCKGALTNYRIKKVVFIQKKSVKEHLKHSYSHLKYELRKRKSTQDTLQEHLFEMHPDYPYK